MVLGNYYLTTEKVDETNEGRVFKDANEALMEYERGDLPLHTRIALPVSSFKHKLFAEDHANDYLVTTVGKIIFNEILPDTFPYVNEPTKENITKITPSKYFLKRGSNIKEEISKLPLVAPFQVKTLKEIIAQIFKLYKTTETSIMLDRLKDLGFKYSTISGTTMSNFDIITAKSKPEIIKESKKTVANINKQYARGLITEEERFQSVVKVWDKAKAQVQKELEEAADKNVDNPIFAMMKSGARGKISQFVQLSGMRGLMTKPGGKVIEIPVISSFKEGLSVSEFFLSTHSARKGSADTALNTASSGYLTRRLVDVSQDVIVKEEDCGTDFGVTVSAFINDKEEVIVDKDEMITEKIADKIVKAGIEKVEIRNILTCETVNGVCQKCYGRNLATGNVVEIGEAVGIMAAQSIGEPGTQLTMRTFHTGGVAGGEDITQGLPRVEELFEARNPKGQSTIATVAGKVSNIVEDHGKYKVYIKNKLEEVEHVTNYGTKLRVEKGDEVNPGDKLTEGNISPKELLAVTDPITAQEYILKEIQKAYRSQGVDINDKHIEVVVSRMISKIRITDGGDTEFLIGALTSMREFTDVNKNIILQGKRPAVGKPILLGITKASLETESFLSAASFQETTRVLTDAAIKGKIDTLQGLKENVIIGKLIPAGTGAKQYRDVSYELNKQFLTDEPMEVMEDEFIE